MTRSFTSSTSPATACTLAWTPSFAAVAPCRAAVAPCCKTVVATRLMRVTGDCFFGAARFAVTFFFGADRAAGFAALFRLALLFVFALLRLPALFDAVDDLRRALPPDDFDAGAMIWILEERFRTSRSARFARNTRQR